MINAIIFSKDRAAQLHLLLESIFKNAKGVFNLNIIYKASNDDFKNAYKLLEADSNSWDTNLKINFIEEVDFKNQTIELLKSNYEYSCFFTDDDIIYNPIFEKNIIETLKSDDDIFCFSLRLGKNTKTCYTMNAENVLVPLTEDDNMIISDWSKHYMDYGYPLSVDGHIFRTKDIYKLTINVGFKNPNTYEAALQIYDNYPKYKMAAFIDSALVNTPINIVQNVFENRKAEQFNYSTEDLNKLYLSGDKISLNNINFQNIHGCHQELELSFVKK